MGLQGWLTARPWPQESTVGPSERPPGVGGWLHTAGGRIVDDDGRTVLLRGFDDDTLLDRRNTAAQRPTPLDDTDAELMRRAGFDVVRLPVAWSLLEPVRHRVDQGYLRRVRDAAALLERHGLRVVLDMHFGVGWGPSSEIPAWARAPLAPDWGPLPAMPWKSSVTAQNAAAESYFWISADWRQDLAESWRAVAGRFRDDPALVGYDLYNEPHPVPIPPGMFESRFLWPSYASLITQVGEVDPNHLFIVEGTLFAGLPTAMEPLRAPNLVYSPHLYVGSLIQVPFEPASAAIDHAVRRAVAEARALPAALWFGELGVDSSSPQALAYTGGALASLAGAGAGWAWWQWRQDGGWGIRSLDGGHLDLATLRRLALPYLEAAPAGVGAREIDGGQGISLGVAPRHAGQPALVSWPGLLLGPPLAAGPCLESAAWRPEAATLALRLAPGRGCTVRVAPAGGAGEWD